MSGIAGIVHFDGRPVAPGLIEGMTAAMAYRGTDGIHHWASGPVALGHCQRHTTPESLEEQQPVISADGQRVLVFDGRLDNWVELRQELLRRGARLRNRSDAELALHAFEVWGDASAEHLDGDFALAIWDARQQRCLLVRDRFGNRALHYHWQNNTLSFATDVRPLLELPWTPKTLDPGALAEHLGIDWHTVDRSLWLDILRVPPSMTIGFTRDAPTRPHQYWAPDPDLRLPHRSEAEHAEHYRHVLTESVRRMSRAIHPVSFEVSGGLDSSALFAVGADLWRRGQLPAPGLRGYTLDFSGQGEADEMVYARAVAEHVGLPVEAVPPYQPGLDWYRECMRETLDLPDYPNGAMNLAVARRAREQGSRTVLSGTGGDEWVGGSPDYRAAYLEDHQWGAALEALWQDWRSRGLLRGSRRFARHAIWPLLPGSVRRPIRHLLKRDAPAEAALWLSHDMRECLQTVADQTSLAPQAQARRAAHIRQTPMLWAPYWQSAKLIGERQMALDGVDWRQPFWAREVVELAFATPAYLHYQGDENKWLHRQAFADLLPPMVTQRQSKAGFDCVFEAIWPDLSRHLNTETLGRRQAWLDVPAARKVIDHPQESRPDAWAEGPAWLLFCMDQLQTFCTSNGGTPLA